MFALMFDFWAGGGFGYHACRSFHANGFAVGTAFPR
jgi:hypothetical protein